MMPLELPSTTRTRPAGAADEIARLRRIERVALEFCARCESGEIRSVATYERFREVLDEAPRRPSPHRAKPDGAHSPRSLRSAALRAVILSE